MAAGKQHFKASSLGCGSRLVAVGRNVRSVHGIYLSRAISRSSHNKLTSGWFDQAAAVAQSAAAPQQPRNNDPPKRCQEARRPQPCWESVQKSTNA